MHQAAGVEGFRVISERVLENGGLARTGVFSERVFLFIGRLSLQAASIQKYPNLQGGQSEVSERRGIKKGTRIDCIYGNMGASSPLFCLSGTTKKHFVVVIYGALAL